MLQRMILLTIVVMLLAACGGGAPTTSETNTDAPTEVAVGFGFIPNVQFAPFYVADSKGYYTEEGLTIMFDYNFETDVIQRLAAGDIQFAHGSGLSTMLARQQGIPVVTVMTQYQQFPVVFFSKEGTPLTQPEDLIDKSIGIPGRFGASYYALQALLYASDIDENQLDIQEVGFNQFTLVLEDNIEVASGYAMNEPVKLREESGSANVLRVADYFPLVSDGLITNEALIAENPDLIQRFVRATLRGLRDTLDNPDEAFEISLGYIPEAELGNTAFERTVLQESLSYWQSEQLGYSESETWEQSHQFLLDLELLNEPLALEEAYTNEFVEQ